uniref:Putative rte ele1 orf1-h 1e-60-j 4 n=1 Tax=Aedes albopictus TaxID=7160 RepID=A0A023ELL0_AEDAL
MAETYIRLKREARRIGLVINVSKAKYMMAKGSREESPRPPPRIYIDGDEIEAVEEFVYLGSLVTADNDTSRQIQRRIVAGNRAYFGLRRTLRLNKDRRHMKLTIYKMLLRPLCSPIWARSMDPTCRGSTCPWIFRTEGVAYHLRRSADGRRNLEKVNEPRAASAAERTNHRPYRENRELRWADHGGRITSSGCRIATRLKWFSRAIRPIQEDVLRSELGRSAKVRTICGSYAEYGTRDKQSWTEWNGDGYYVQQRPPRP